MATAQGAAQMGQALKKFHQTALEHNKFSLLVSGIRMRCSQEEIQGANGASPHPRQRFRT